MQCAALPSDSTVGTAIDNLSRIGKHDKVVPVTTSITDMLLTDFEDKFAKSGFVVLPSFITDDEQADLLRYLENSLTGSPAEANLSIAQRSSARRDSYPTHR